VLTGILRTIKREMVIRTLGKLPSPERRAYDKVLRGSLGLSA
jgi:hypothetical protein